MRTLILLLALALPAWAADTPKKAVPLVMAGDTTLIVKSFDKPLTITAPAPAKASGVVYECTWTYPPTITATEADNVLTVTSAPNGTFTVSVTIRVTDFNAKTITKDTGTIDVVVGAPTPTPPVPTGLAKALQDAYAAETDAQKAVRLPFIASVFRNAGTLADASTSNADLFTRLSAQLHAPTTGYPKGEMKVVMATVGDYITANVGLATSTTYDKAKAKQAFADIAAALSGVKVISTHPRKHIERRR